MSLRRLARKLQWLCVPLAVLLGMQGTLYGQECCGTHCLRVHCPPPYFHCMHGPPCLKVKYGCPLPVCSPCNAPNWGYNQPCWRPNPWPADWSRCPYPVPAGTVAPCPQGPMGALSLPTSPGGPQQLPSARPLPGVTPGL